MYTTTIDKPIDEFVIQQEEVECIEWYPKDVLENELAQNPDRFLESIKQFVRL